MSPLIWKVLFSPPPQTEGRASVRPATTTVKGTFTASVHPSPNIESVCAPHKVDVFIPNLSSLESQSHCFPPAQRTDRLIALRCVNLAANSQVGPRLFPASPPPQLRFLTRNLSQRPLADVAKHSAAALPPHLGPLMGSTPDDKPLDHVWLKPFIVCSNKPSAQKQI